MRFDVIVCGAGPAGSTAARLLAESGRKVALIEKRKLPRHKTCGGGIPVAVGKHLRDLAPSAFVESNVKRMRHTYRFRKAVISRINLGAGSDQSLWMVQRSIFDNALAAAAAAAGAELMDGLAVSSLEIGADGVKIEARSGRQAVFAERCQHVIGADGANGVCARMAGLRPTRDLAIAIEIEKPHRWGSGHESLTPDIAHLDFGSIDHGYAWVFPKADHLNIGAGVIYPDRKRNRGENRVRTTLHRAIFDYMRSLDIPFRQDELEFHAHPLPVWQGSEALVDPRGRVLLAGDAAGLVNPFFGDGILNAIRSGEMAARSIIAGEITGYQALIREGFAANLDSAGQYANFFYRHPLLCYQLGVRREEATRAAMRLLSGELSFPDLRPKIIRRLKSKIGLAA